MLNFGFLDMWLGRFHAHVLADCVPFVHACPSVVGAANFRAVV